MNTEYSTYLETNYADKIRDIAKENGFELRLHVGSNLNPSCALVPIKTGRTYVFENLEALNRYLLRLGRGV